MKSLDEKDLERLNRKEKLLRDAAGILSVEEKDLPRVVARFLKEVEEMESRK